jgi:DNA-binding transcriptional regulator YhcF (GntR family)
MIKDTKLHQIIAVLETEISAGTYSGEDKLPSLNKLRRQHNVSRETVIKAYKDLQSRGLVRSAPGKGYFYSGKKVSTKIRVLLVFDELSPYKSVLLHSVDRQFKSRGIDYTVFFHHQNASLLRTLLQENAHVHTHYAIMPVPGDVQVMDTLAGLCYEKRILLDRHDHCNINSRYVGQEFEKDVYTGLHTLLEASAKYKDFTLIFPENSVHPSELKDGVRSFCAHNGFGFSVITPSKFQHVQKGSAYVVIDDEDLVQAIHLARKAGLVPGRDIGLLSYNETPLKSVVADGITTLSTDFDKMGRNLTDMLEDPSIHYIHNPFKVFIRKSF